MTIPSSDVNVTLSDAQFKKLLTAIKLDNTRFEKLIEAIRAEDPGHRKVVTAVNKAAKAVKELTEAVGKLEAPAPTVPVTVKSQVSSDKLVSALGIEFLTGATNSGTSYSDQPVETEA